MQSSPQSRLIEDSHSASAPQPRRGGQPIDDTRSAGERRDFDALLGPRHRDRLLGTRVGAEPAAHTRTGGELESRHTQGHSALPFGGQRETTRRTNTNTEVTSDTAMRTARVDHEIGEERNVHRPSLARSERGETLRANRTSPERGPKRPNPIRNRARHSEQASARPLHDDDLGGHGETIEKRRGRSEQDLRQAFNPNRRPDESACFAPRLPARARRAPNARRD